MFSVHHSLNNSIAFFLAIIVGMAYAWKNTFEQPIADPRYPYDVIGVPKLHQKNIKGATIGVALLDFFPETQQETLALKPVKEWKNLRNLPDFRLPGDPIDHGTHVAGIVHRVAPEARLFRLSVTIDPYDFRQIMKDDTIAILSVSAFQHGDWVVRQIADALQQGKIFILAAGNDSENISQFFNPFRWILSRLEGVDPNLLRQVILALNLRRPLRKESAMGLFFPASSPVSFPFALHHSSNFPGEHYLDIALAAPGEEIESDLANGKTEKMTGTSMAAPMIAGVAALLFQAYDSLKGIPPRNDTERQERARLVVRALLEGAIKQQGSRRLPTFYFGQGIVNAEGALNWLFMHSNIP